MNTDVIEVSVLCMKIHRILREGNVSGEIAFAVISKVLMDMFLPSKFEPHEFREYLELINVQYNGEYIRNIENNICNNTKSK
jgi:hypothetical protein